MNEKPVVADVTQKFYDSMASQYDKFYLDWQAATHEEARFLSGIFQEYGFDRTARILDCACGIGTRFHRKGRPLQPQDGPCRDDCGQCCGSFGRDACHLHEPAAAQHSADYRHADRGHQHLQKVITRETLLSRIPVTV